MRWFSLLKLGGWKRPKRGSSPPLEVQWLATTKKEVPLKVNSATSGRRLASKAFASPPGYTAELGSGSCNRPGLELISTVPFEGIAEVLPVEVLPGPVLSTKLTRSGLKKKPTRMLPPGSPPSASSIGLI